MGKVSVIMGFEFVDAGKITLVGRLVQELAPGRTAVIMHESQEIQGSEETGLMADFVGVLGSVRADLSRDRNGAWNPCSWRRLADVIIRAVRSGRCETILIENAGGMDSLLVADLFETRTPDGGRLAEGAQLDQLITVIDAERFWLDYESGDTLGERGVGQGLDHERAVAELLGINWNVPPRLC